VIEMRAFV